MTPLASITSVLDSGSKFAWPLIVVVALCVAWPEIRRLLRSRAFTIKVGNFELSAQDANDQLARQVSDLQMRLVRLEEIGREPSASATPEPAPPPQRETSGLPAPAPAPSPNKEGVRPDADVDHRSRDVLWVDDNPSGNAFEIRTLEASGRPVTTVKSTSEGLEAYERISPSVVITDLGRQESGKFDRDAGLNLIHALKSREPGVPIVVYTSSRSAKERHHELLAAGATAVTASPSDLIKQVEAASPQATSAGGGSRSHQP